MTLSTHEVPIVEVHLQPHPNADSLSIVQIDGYTVVVRTADWVQGQLGAYIQPDSVISTEREEFAFLKREGRDRERIRVIKLRGVVSMGLLIPAPPGFSVGDDVAKYFGVEHYEPETNLLKQGADNVMGPKIYAPVYDVETIMKYHKLLEDGEEVLVHEKLHGANTRYVLHQGKMWCGSRRNWKDPQQPNGWTRALHNTPSVENFCQSHPDTIVYGEIYGQVQNLKYGQTDIQFSAFDILHQNQWMEPDEFLQACHTYNVPHVPLLYRGPYSFDKIKELAEGPSTIEGANHVREGCVVRPAQNRSNVKIGRIVLKCVGNGYYMNKKT